MHKRGWVISDGKLTSCSLYFILGKTKKNKPVKVMYCTPASFPSSLIPCLAPSPFLPPTVSVCGALWNRWRGQGWPPDRRRERQPEAERRSREVGNHIHRVWDGEAAREQMCKTQTTLWSLRLNLDRLRTNPPTALTVHIRGAATPLVSYPGHPLQLISSRLSLVYLCKYGHHLQY